MRGKSQTSWDKACGVLLDQLREHHRAGGPPIHIDIVTDDEEPSVVWPQVYVMSPVYEDGRIARWWCTGCGHGQPAEGGSL